LNLFASRAGDNDKDSDTELITAEEKNRKSNRDTVNTLNTVEDGNYEDDPLLN